MSTTSKLSAATGRGTVLSTELNSLANGSRSNAGTELDNSVNRDRYAVAELSVNFSGAPTAGSVVALYAITAPDGTNYEDGSSSADPGAHRWIGNFPLKNASGAQRISTLPFALTPFKTKFLVVNSSGQAFPASGSTVKIYSYNDEGS